MREARSIAEARLYIGREPCPGCGAVGFSEPSRIIERGERLGVACSGYCPTCGALRELELLLGEERVPPLALGNAAPSSLIDAGEWLLLANEHAENAELSKAIAALAEVLKFYEDGAAEPPMSAFFTAAGRAAYRADAGRFSRFRIEAVLDAWRAHAAKANGT